jgi:hypothetical protein
MDLEAVEVADHQERQVLQILAVLEQLVIRLFQVGMLALYSQATCPRN